MTAPIVVPYTALSAEALEGVIEEFITREGTDYGHHEHSLEQKRASVFKQIQRGDVVIVFDPEAEATSLVRKDALR